MADNTSTASSETMNFCTFVGGSCSTPQNIVLEDSDAIIQHINFKPCETCLADVSREPGRVHDGTALATIEEAAEQRLQAATAHDMDLVQSYTQQIHYLVALRAEAFEQGYLVYGDHGYKCAYTTNTRPMLALPTEPRLIDAKHINGTLSSLWWTMFHRDNKYPGLNFAKREAICHPAFTTAIREIGDCVLGLDGEMLTPRHMEMALEHALEPYCDPDDKMKDRTPWPIRSFVCEWIERALYCFVDRAEPQRGDDTDCWGHRPRSRAALFSRTCPDKLSRLGALKFKNEIDLELYLQSSITGDSQKLLETEQLHAEA